MINRFISLILLITITHFVFSEDSLASFSFEKPSEEFFEGAAEIGASLQLCQGNESQQKGVYFSNLNTVHIYREHFDAHYQIKICYTGPSPQKVDSASFSSTGSSTGSSTVTSTGSSTGSSTNGGTSSSGGNTAAGGAPTVDPTEGLYRISMNWTLLNRLDDLTAVERYVQDSEAVVFLEGQCRLRGGSLVNFQSLPFSLGLRNWMYETYINDHPKSVPVACEILVKVVERGFLSNTGKTLNSQRRNELIRMESQIAIDISKYF